MRSISIILALFIASAMLLQPNPDLQVAKTDINIGKYWDKVQSGSPQDFNINFDSVNYLASNPIVIDIIERVLPAQDPVIDSAPMIDWKKVYPAKPTQVDGNPLLPIPDPTIEPVVKPDVKGTIDCEPNGNGGFT